MRKYSWIFLAAICGTASAQIPKTGTDSTIEIANWNIEWFGNTSNGPTNEKLQQQNAANIIHTTDMDLWGLGEISDLVAWDTLLKRLRDYGGIISTWEQTQKTALLYKKSIFKALYSRHILAVYDMEFASGRLPLEVGLEMDMGTWKDTLYVFVLHLKANTGTTQEKADAWDRRKRSSEALKAYIDAMGKWKKSIVLGDWNDDVDVSIFSNYATPFSKIVNDSTAYFFPSKALSLARQKSTTSYTEMIDHQCITKRLRNDYLSGSAKVLYLQNYIGNYSSTTSDHYPVYSLYKISQPTLSVNSLEPRPIGIYCDGERIVFKGMAIPPKYEVYDIMGRKCSTFQPGQILFVRYLQGTTWRGIRVVVPVK